jgi:hypothetical protein
MKKNYAHRDWSRLDDALDELWEQVKSVLVTDEK